MSTLKVPRSGTFGTVLVVALWVWCSSVSRTEPKFRLLRFWFKLKSVCLLWDPKLTNGLLVPKDAFDGERSGGRLLRPIYVLPFDNFELVCLNMDSRLAFSTLLNGATQPPKPVRVLFLSHVKNACQAPGRVQRFCFCEYVRVCKFRSMNRAPKPKACSARWRGFNWLPLEICLQGKSEVNGSHCDHCDAIFFLKRCLIQYCRMSTLFFASARVPRNREVLCWADEQD